MDFTISGAMPIHNEEAFLPYTLATLVDAGLNELVVVLDRCSDKSEAIIDKFALKTNYPIRKFVVEKRKWKHRTAEVFNIAIKNTESEVIYPLGGDCMYDTRIFEIDWRPIDFATFSLIDYDLLGDQWRKIRANIINVYRKIVQLGYTRMTRKPLFHQVQGFKRQVFKSVGIHDVYHEDTVFTREANRKGFRYRFFPQFTSVHLGGTQDLMDAVLSFDSAKKS